MHTRLLTPAIVEYDYGSSMSVFCAPDPRVRPWVHGSYQGWIERVNRPNRRREVPCDFIPVILNWAQAFGVIDPIDPLGTVTQFDSFAAGLSDRHVVVESRGSSGCIQVNLTPIGAHLLFGLPMDALTNRTVDLIEILGAAGRELIARLHDATDWETRFAAVDALLVSRLANARPRDAGVAWAWASLIASRGTMTVGSLGRELGWSRKQLVARFREQIGLAPKTAARVLRFQQVVRVLRNADLVHWADLALRTGYYDQAHFIREFGELAGCTPTEYLGRRLPDGGVTGD
jgi:AraC-like DNA-binding protein